MGGGGGGGGSKQNSQIHYIADVFEKHTTFVIAVFGLIK